MLNRITAFLYGTACYAISLVTFLYTAAFLGNFPLPGLRAFTSIDAQPSAVSATSLLQALFIDLGLLALFSVQHSVMARPAFKAAWTRIIPPVVERSTYLLFSCATLLLVLYFWQPIGGIVWSVNLPATRVALYILYALGWVVILAATFLIDHFDLFGLRQVWFHLRGRTYTAPVFRTPGLYRLVRHPLYVGWLMVFWSAPLMTAAHLVFALATTAYILIAIQLEERDLTRLHPEYANYRVEVPMLLPFKSTNKATTTKALEKQAS